MSMQEMMGPSTPELMEIIETAFPFMGMPAQPDLVVPGCVGGDYLSEELDSYRNKQIDGNVIRLVHQELSHLTPKAWQWILPHYLRFCLTAEAAYNQMETEFLIYNLGPDVEFQADTTKRLSLLTRGQISCLISFLQWCRNQEHWKEVFSDRIDSGIDFLGKVLLTK